MKLNFWSLILAGCAIGLLAGCTANKAYRTDLKTFDASQGATDYTAVVEAGTNYQLGFVEFDDQGWFWNRDQWSTVQKMIESQIGLGEDQTNGIVMVLFVHGWKNNAAYDSGNVQTFRQSLSEMAKAEKAQSALDGRPVRRVVGVYAGWRGLSAELEPFKELSFWERKNTAHKVGHGAFTELLSRLEDLEQSSNKVIPKGKPKSELIVIGHSFGGGAVYSAVTQILTERFVDSIEHGKKLQSFGDLVILLNPAFEASRYENLNELATGITNFPSAQRPVMAIFTSKADWATRYAFPAGRVFSTFFEKHRSDKHQWAADIVAVGHHEPFITHDLIYDADLKTNFTAHTTLDPKTQKHLMPDQEQLKASLQNIKNLRTQWHTNNTVPVTFLFDDCKLSPRPHYTPKDPFLIVSVDKKIMKSHDDINNPILVNFLREFILFSRTSPLKTDDEPSKP